MRYRALFSATLVLALAHRGGAQDSLGTAALDSASGAQLVRIVASVQSRGLPTEPIVAKVRRGVLIHAPTPRILAAAEAVAQRLEAARAALAPDPNAADIMAGEDALSIGVDENALKAVRAASPHQSVAVPLGVLAQLVASGVPSKRATTMVTELIRRGVTNAQLVALGNDVNSDVARGARAEASFDTRIGGLTAVLAPAGAGTSAGTAVSAPSAIGPPKKPPL
jgi:hypothetical protein